MNQLNVSIQQSIVALIARGWSQRRIARELQLDRATVARYAQPVVAKPATISTHGSAAAAAESKPASSAPESEAKPASNSTHGSGAAPPAKPAISTHGATAGRKSLCTPFATVITTSLELGLSAQRIYQDLVREHAYTGGYQSVKRFTRKVAHKLELPFRRMECEPGDELQIDFGCGAWIKEEGGRRRRPHLFRAVLSHSRKGYSEVVWRQDTETVIRCVENAFRFFGGVTATLVPDIDIDWVPLSRCLGTVNRVPLRRRRLQVTWRNGRTPPTATLTGNRSPHFLAFCSAAAMFKRTWCS